MKADPKSDKWVQILRLSAIIEYIIFVVIAIYFLIKAMFEGEKWYFYFSISAWLVGTGIFITNMVIVNALYNIQEIRKAVCKEGQYYKNEELPSI